MSIYIQALETTHGAIAGAVLGMAVVAIFIWIMMIPKEREWSEIMQPVLIDREAYTGCAMFTESFLRWQELERKRNE